MADKRLIYNDNGTNAEIPDSGSGKAAYFDEGSNTLVVRGLTITKVTASIGSINGILGTDANGKLTTITSGTVNGRYLQSDGTNWAFRDATGEGSGSYLSPSDLTGSLSAPTVLSIQNVTSGALSALNGGTGVSTFTSGGIFVKDNTSTMKMLRPDAGASVLRPDGSGSWYSGGSTGTASYSVSASYYSASPTLYTWSKPSTHKNVKIILMGGGGGGGAGQSQNPGTFGVGGGAGGFSVYDIFSSADLVASVSVGSGGLGGIATSSPSVIIPGASGANTYFSSSNIYYFAGGGAGGGGGGPAAVPASEKGYGNLSFNLGLSCGSGNGGNSAPISATGTSGQSANIDRLVGFFTASGGSGGAGVPTVNTAGNPGSAGQAVNVSFGVTPYYAAFGGGGGGGSRTGPAPSTNKSGGNGGSGISGSGGGGGACTVPGSGNIGGNGGNGGDGYAIIISW